MVPNPVTWVESSLQRHASREEKPQGVKGTSYGGNMEMFKGINPQRTQVILSARIDFPRIDKHNMNCSLSYKSLQPSWCSKGIPTSLGEDIPLKNKYDWFNTAWFFLLNLQKAKISKTPISFWSWQVLMDIRTKTHIKGHNWLDYVFHFAEC